MKAVFSVGLVIYWTGITGFEQLRAKRSNLFLRSTKIDLSFFRSPNHFQQIATLFAWPCQAKSSNYRFLQDLEKNNSKDWMDHNRERYHEVRDWFATWFEELNAI